ncbi:hypothetical protein PAL_GLEAN10022971 [Pteropus alecto]|uniref:Uncharacterized protein n=1 Tax=Pteropus alecto TaxID=9402 RepID=L5K4Y2_PTEAL|nr:hypothetical protein PAL_GLEAN10022971 [Pteropus alecto]
MGHPGSPLAACFSVAGPRDKPFYGLHTCSWKCTLSAPGWGLRPSTAVTHPAQPRAGPAGPGNHSSRSGEQSPGPSGSQDRPGGG